MNDAPNWEGDRSATNGGGGDRDGYGGGGRSPSPRRDRDRDGGDRRERDGRSRSPARGGAVGGGDDRGRGAANNPGNNLHVSSLSSRTEERDLEDAFSKYGPVEKCQVVRDPQTKDSRGFAFVTMETPEAAAAAIEGLNATELNGRTINVEKARRGRARTPTPGSYLGPPKRSEYGGGGGYGNRPYAPGGYGRRGYDTSAMPMRDDPRDRRYDDRGGGRRYDDRDRDYRRDDYRRDDRRDRYDDRPPRRDDRERGYSGGGGDRGRDDYYYDRDRR